MKLPMAKIGFVTVLVMTIVVAVKSTSPPTNCLQGSAKAKLSGTVISHSSQNVAGEKGKKYSIFIKLKDCKCEECKGKCSDCCIPQATIDSDDNGRFQFSLGPGTYSVQVNGRDSSRIEIDVSAGESKTITLTAD